MIIGNGYNNQVSCSYNNCISCPKKNNCVIYLTYLTEKIYAELQEGSGTGGYPSLEDIQKIIEQGIVKQNQTLDVNLKESEKYILANMEKYYEKLKEEIEDIQKDCKMIKKKLRIKPEEDDEEDDDEDLTPKVFDYQDEYLNDALVLDKEQENGLQPFKKEEDILIPKKNIFGKTKWVQDKKHK